MKGSLKADVLINTTAVGMHPNEDGNHRRPSAVCALHACDGRTPHRGGVGALVQTHPCPRRRSVATRVCSTPSTRRWRCARACRLSAFFWLETERKRGNVTQVHVKATDHKGPYSNA